MDKNIDDKTTVSLASVTVTDSTSDDPTTTLEELGQSLTKINGIIINSSFSSTTEQQKQQPDTTLSSSSATASTTNNTKQDFDEESLINQCKNNSDVQIKNETNVNDNDNNKNNDDANNDDYDLSEIIIKSSCDDVPTLAKQEIVVSSPFNNITDENESNKCFIKTGNNENNNENYELNLFKSDECDNEQILNFNLQSEKESCCENSKDSDKTLDFNDFVNNKRILEIQNQNYQFNKENIGSVKSDDDNEQQLKNIQDYDQSVPPVPLDTYRWEDIRRARRKGGYPWTYLDPQETIVLSRSRRSTSRKSLDETVNKIEEINLPILLQPTINNNEPTPSTASSAATGIENEIIVNKLSSECEEKPLQRRWKSEPPKSPPSSPIAEHKKIFEIDNAKIFIKNIVKRAAAVHPPKNIFKSKEKTIDTNQTNTNIPSLSIQPPTPEQQTIESNNNTTNKNTPSTKKITGCHPFVNKLKTMADNQYNKGKMNIKKYTLRSGDEKIKLNEPQKILNLKVSPRADRRSEIPSYVIKQDSDDQLDIVQLDDSPSELRRRREIEHDEQQSIHNLPISDEIIQLPIKKLNEDSISIEPKIKELIDDEFSKEPPKKSPRKLKDHYYEDIPDDDDVDDDLSVKNIISLVEKIDDNINKNFKFVVEGIDDGSDDLSIKKSNLKQDASPFFEKKVTFSASTENEPIEDDGTTGEPHREDVDLPNQPKVTNSRWSTMRDHEYEPIADPQIEQTTTLDAITNTAEPILVTEVVTTDTTQTIDNKSLEPIIDYTIDTATGYTVEDEEEGAVGGVTVDVKTDSINENIDENHDIQDEVIDMETQSRLLDQEIAELKLKKIGAPLNEEIESKFITSPHIDHAKFFEGIEPLTKSNTDQQDHKKSFMESANDHSKIIQEKLRGHASRLKIKVKNFKPNTKKNNSNNKLNNESPKVKKSKRFKSPEFTKLKNIQIHKPEFKRPEFTKFKTPEFKRPDFKINFPNAPKFPKTDISKLKLPERLQSFRFQRSKSLKEPPTAVSMVTNTTETDDIPPPSTSKKRFEFGTYPRIFDRLRKQSKQPDSSVSRDDEGPESDEISDRVISPVQFGTFPKVGKRVTHPIASTTVSNLSNDEQYQRYSSEPPDCIEDEDDINRLSTRINNDQIDDYIPDDDEQPDKDTSSKVNSGNVKQTEEQKQLDEYDKENRAIYQISKARENEFKQRKPLVHQESDLVSEDSGRDFGWIENENLRKRIQARSSEMDISPSRDYIRESNSNVDDEMRERGSTQETQSSGSSSYLRRKGVIEEVDDDEFYLRKKGISQDDIQLGNYISSAIRDGIEGSPNLMARLSQYDHRYYDEDFDDVNTNEQPSFEEYNVHPPTKPKRVKDVEKKLSSDRHPYVETNQQPPEIPVAAEYYQHNENNDRLFYNQEYFDDIDEQFKDNILLSRDTRISTPQPIAPLRRKKLLRDTIDKESFTASLQFDDDDDLMRRRSRSNSFLPKGNVEDIVVYRTEHEYIIPFEQSDPIAPTPAPRARSRSRSQSRSQIKLNNDDNCILNQSDSLPFTNEAKYIVEMNETNKYAVVRKEPPPRPPAPARKRNQNRGDKQQFATMPHLNKDKSNTINQQEEIFSTPVRPIRNYSTIGPTRPPRRSSIISLEEVEKPQPHPITDTTEYEEIDGFDKPNCAGRNLSSGNTLTKMKHRPLPPPPRPPRERKPKKTDSTDDPDDRYDKDEGGRERMIPVTLEDFSQISSMEEVEEVEAATQTDPLSDDFTCEEFEVNDDMPVIEPTSSYKKTTSKTLEEILKEEQQAELDRAKQIADEECLTKGIQKFRDANQRSFSERSRGSTNNDRPKTPSLSSRPITPIAVVIEKKVTVGTTETDARLTVRPVQNEYLPVPRIDSLDDDGSDTKYMDDTADTEDERIVTEALRRYRLLEENNRPREISPVPISATPQQIEQIIEPVDDDIVESDTENILAEYDDEDEDERQIPSILTLRENDIDDEEIPIPPPRRRSSTTEAAILGMEQTIQRVPDPPLELLHGGRLHIQDLEVENLSVGGLQAGRIVVSDLRAISITSPDLENRNTENIVLNGIELPPGFIEDIVDRVLNSERKAAQLQQESVVQQQQQQQQQQEQNQIEEIKLIETGGHILQVTEETVSIEELQQQQPPERPPPPPPQSLYPSDSAAAYSIPPPSFYQLRDYAEDLDPYLQPLHTPSAARRRRHHRRRDDSTSDEEYPHEREQRRNRHGGNRSPEPSITDLSGKLLRACGSALSRTSTQFMDMIRAKTKENENETGSRQDLNIALIIVIVFVAILMMLGIGNGSRPVHHHHWDYFNPPENNGRK